jgi:ketosteroid isomerase-like protein
MAQRYPARVVRRGASAAAAALALALALGACGEEEGVTAQVRGAVGDFAEATAKKDFQRICDDLLARELVRGVEQVGLPCEVALQRGLGEVEAPTLEVRSVVVNGDRALAEVDSTARGQRPSRDSLELVRQQGAWRIASLARAQPQPRRTTP